MEGKSRCDESFLSKEIKGGVFQGQKFHLTFSKGNGTSEEILDFFEVYMGISSKKIIVSQNSESIEVLLWLGKSRTYTYGKAFSFRGSLPSIRKVKDWWACEKYINSNRKRESSEAIIFFEKEKGKDKPSIKSGLNTYKERSISMEMSELTPVLFFSPFPEDNAKKLSSPFLEKQIKLMTKILMSCEIVETISKYCESEGVWVYETKVVDGEKSKKDQAMEYLFNVYSVKSNIDYFLENRKRLKIKDEKVLSGIRDMKKPNYLMWYGYKDFLKECMNKYIDTLRERGIEKFKKATFSKVKKPWWCMYGGLHSSHKVFAIKNKILLEEIFVNERTMKRYNILIWPTELVLDDIKLAISSSSILAL